MKNVMIEICDQRECSKILGVSCIVHTYSLQYVVNSSGLSMLNLSKNPEFFISVLSLYSEYVHTPHTLYVNTAS